MERVAFCFLAKGDSAYLRLYFEHRATIAIIIIEYAKSLSYVTINITPFVWE